MYHFFFNLFKNLTPFPRDIFSTKTSFYTFYPQTIILHNFILQLKKMIYFCIRLQGGYNMAVRVFPVSHWRDGRVVECGGLENRCTERYRGFESLSLRGAKTQNNANPCKSELTGIFYYAEKGRKRQKNTVFWWTCGGLEKQLLQVLCKFHNPLFYYNLQRFQLQIHVLFSIQRLSFVSLLIYAS